MGVFSRITLAVMLSRCASTISTGLGCHSGYAYSAHVGKFAYKYSYLPCMNEVSSLYMREHKSAAPGTNLVAPTSSMLGLRSKESCESRRETTASKLDS